MLYLLRELLSFWYLQFKLLSCLYKTKRVATPLTSKINHVPFFPVSVSVKGLNLKSPAKDRAVTIYKRYMYTCTCTCMCNYTVCNDDILTRYKSIVNCIIIAAIIIIINAQAQTWPLHVPLEMLQRHVLLGWHHFFQ